MAIGDNLEGLYHANSDWLDSSGNDRHITNSGGIFRTSGQILGSADADYDGIDDHGDITGLSNPFTDQMTIAIWIQLKTLGASQNNAQILAKWSGAENSFLLGFRPSDANEPWFIVQNSSGVNKTAFCPVIADTNKHLLIATYDGSNVTLSLDNVNGAPVAQTGNIRSTAHVPRIGDYTGGGEGQYKGYWDELVIESQAWDASEKTAFWNGGAGVQIGISEAIFKKPIGMMGMGKLGVR